MDPHEGKVRREFFRIDVSIPIEIVCMDGDGRIAHNSWLPATVVELGGGGARLAVPFIVATGDSLCMRFSIPDTEDKVEVYARVVELFEDDGTHLACVKFVGLTDDQQKLLISFTYREQLRAGQDAGDERRGES
jgi:c-di-GMP-binding flagellar brake protein YcgR